jgi:capsular polysaccharide biosynthesis protein
VATQVKDAVVEVAAVAVAPEGRVRSRRVMNVGIALVLGLIIGVLSAFGVEYFKKTGEKLEGERRRVG